MAMSVYTMHRRLEEEQNIGSRELWKMENGRYTYDDDGRTCNK